MEIILLQDLRNLGQRGEVVDVKPGYARNYLLPQGVALEATRGNLAYFEQQREKIDAAHTKARDEAEAIAAKIGETRIEIRKRVGEKSTLYGSVTALDVVHELAEHGIEVEKRQLDLGTPTLKTVGEHPVTVDLYADVVAELVVAIVPAE
ncbi:MAG: 50S ribosomal protein L9 [Acidobacteriota bacterium]